MSRRRGEEEEKEVKNKRRNLSWCSPPEVNIDVRIMINSQYCKETLKCLFTLLKVH